MVSWKAIYITWIERRLIDRLWCGLLETIAFHGMVGRAPSSASGHGLLVRAWIAEQRAISVDETLIQLLDEAVVLELVLLPAAKDADEHDEHNDRREEKHSIEDRLHLIDFIYAL